MISILEKDGAVIITVENPSVKEKELIRQAKALNSSGSSSSVFSKFKCNKSKTLSADNSGSRKLRQSGRIC